MGVVVTTPASSHDLTTYGLVALELGLDAGDTSIASRIEPLIAEVSDEIARSCGLPFGLARQTYTETLAGYGDRYLVLSQRPIVSITSITDDETLIDSDEYRIESPTSGMVYRSDGWWSSSSWGYSNGEPLFTVVYVAGYILPGTGVTETLPPAIRRTATELVVAAFSSSGRERGVVEQRMGDLTVKYDVGDEIPASMLSRVRRAIGLGRAFV
jgi:hypothetical protein